MRGESSGGAGVGASGGAEEDASGATEATVKEADIGGADNEEPIKENGL